MTKKKAVSFYGWSQHNAGDLAITLGVIDLLLRKKYAVTVFSRYNENSDKFYDFFDYIKERYKAQVTVHPCPFHLDRETDIPRKLNNYIKSIQTLVCGKEKRKMISEIESSDLAILNGGNLFRCNSFSDAARLIALTFPFWLAKRHHTPYVTMPQSAGNLNIFGKIILGWLFKNANSVFVRESASLKRLSNQFPRCSFNQSLDAAFFILKNEAHSTPSKNKSLTVGLTLRAWGLGDLKEFSDAEHINIIDYFVRLFDSLPFGTKVMLVSQGLKDEKITKSLYNTISSRDSEKPVELISSLDPIYLSSLYQDCDWVIGMRLHSLILAASAGSKVHGLFYREWGLKNPGVLNDLGFSYDWLDEAPNIDWLSITKREISKKLIDDKILQSRQKLERSLIFQE